MSRHRAPASLPPSFYKYFWDVDPASVNPQRHPQYVIERLLDLGDPEVVRWVWQHFPQEVLRKTIKMSRNVSLRTAKFWARLFGIPEEELRCMQKPYLNMRKHVWPA